MGLLPPMAAWWSSINSIIVSGVAILSAENSGKPLGGWGSTPYPANEPTVLSRTDREPGLNLWPVTRAVASLRSRGAPAFGGWARGGCEQMSPLPPRGSGGCDPRKYFCILLIQNPAFCAFFDSKNGHYQCFYQDPYALGEMKDCWKRLPNKPGGPKSRPKAESRVGYFLVQK